MSPDGFSRVRVKKLADTASDGLIESLWEAWPWASQVHMLLSTLVMKKGKLGWYEVVKIE